MAGGTSGKTSTSLMAALAAIKEAEKAIHQLVCQGVPAGDPRHAAKSDPAISAAVSALQAIQ
jgi:hypothetical protein